MRYSRRFDALLKAYGEDLTLTAGQASRNIRAFCRPLDSSTIRAYFDDADAALLERPALLALVSGSEQVSIGNALLREGRTFTVRKIGTYRLRNSAVGKALMLD